MNAPLGLRQGKTLYLHTVRQMFPRVFAVPGATVVCYATYWLATFRQQRADLRAWIEAQANPLDDVLEPDVLLSLLDSDLTAHTRVNSALRARAKKVYYFLQGVHPRLTALTGLTLVRPTVPAAQVLKWALVLRAFLQSAQSKL